MAEIQEKSGGGKKGGVKKGKKLSTRIDLTPMVDLGFLLITFFIFTTTMSKPKTMDIVMPSDKPLPPNVKPTLVKDYTVMTVLLSKEHRVYYYLGIGSDPLNPPKVNVTYFQNKNGIRDALIALHTRVLEERNNGAAGHDPSDVPVVIIKPDTTCTFDDMVNMWDELRINDIQISAMVDISDVDRDFIKATETANGG